MGQRIHGGETARMIKIKSRGGEPAEVLIKRFKKACEKEGLVRDMKKHAFFEKPSILNARKRRQSRKRRQLANKANMGGF
jgi:small subunit ribosomal protein S21